MNAFFTEQFAVDFATEWIAAWNVRDLDRILKSLRSILGKMIES